MAKLAQYDTGPILLVEPSDNIGGGAPGDLTIVLKAFVEAGIQNAAVCLNDPEAVQILRDLPIGAKWTMVLGGKSGQRERE